MAKIEIYTKESCPYCIRAKALLEAKGASYTEHNMQNKLDELEALKNRTGLKTVPQIFINDKLIGGFSELAKLDSEGKLDELLA